MTFFREFVVVLTCLFATQVLASETRKMVAIIDTGMPNDSSLLKYMCKGKHADFTGFGLRDNHGHGTNVLGIILKKINPNTHCIVIIKYFNTVEAPYGSRSPRDIFNSIYNYLVFINPAYINFSGAGSGFNVNEFYAIAKLLDNGAKVVVAAGNNGLKLEAGSCEVFPACYFFDEPNFYVVGANTKSSNYGGPVRHVREGLNQCGLGVCRTGSSQATANMTAELLGRESRGK
jgi:hypothetical protein